MDIEADLAAMIDEHLQELQGKTACAANTALPESDDDLADSLLQEFDAKQAANTGASSSASGAGAREDRNEFGLSICACDMQPGDVVTFLCGAAQFRKTVEFRELFLAGERHGRRKAEHAGFGGLEGKRRRNFILNDVVDLRLLVPSKERTAGTDTSGGATERHETPESGETQTAPAAESAPEVDATEAMQQEEWGDPWPIRSRPGPRVDIDDVREGDYISFLFRKSQARRLVIYRGADTARRNHNGFLGEDQKGATKHK